jgi:hypothetical protein
VNDVRCQMKTEKSSKKMKFKFVFVTFCLFSFNNHNNNVNCIKVQEPIVKFSEVTKFECNSSTKKRLFDDRVKIVKIKNKFYLNGTIEFMNRLNQKQFTYVTVTTIPQQTRIIDYYNFCLFMSHEEFFLFPLLKDVKHCPLKLSVSVFMNKRNLKFKIEIIST